MAGEFLLDWVQMIGQTSKGLLKTLKRVSINKMKNRMKKLMMMGLVFLGLSWSTDLSAQANCDNSCIDWFLVITDDRGNVLSETFLYTTCDGKQTISACEQSGSEAKIILTKDQSLCEEEWHLYTVMSTEDNAFCGSYVKVRGRVTSGGRGNWSAKAYLDKEIGAHFLSGICQTAFYAIQDRSYVSRADEPNVAAGFIADVGYGINISIGDGKIVNGEGTIWFDAAYVSTFRHSRFVNPLCW
jgi:hypothetical protein